VRIAIVCDNYSPHLTTKRCRRVGTWAAANNVEIAYTPTNSSWLNRIEAQFTALRYFALDGTDHASHKEQGSMIRRYIIWRNKHAADDRLPSGGEQGERCLMRTFSCRVDDERPLRKSRYIPPLSGRRLEQGCGWQASTGPCDRIG
jgi:hypothetical protein